MTSILMTSILKSACQNMLCLDSPHVLVAERLFDSLYKICSSSSVVVLCSTLHIFRNNAFDRSLSRNRWLRYCCYCLNFEIIYNILSSRSIWEQTQVSIYYDLISVVSCLLAVYTSMCSSHEIKFICPLGMLHLIFLETTLSLLPS